MKGVTSWITNILQNLVASWIWLVITTSLPSIGAYAIIVTDIISTPAATIGIGFGWSVSIFCAAVWYRSRKAYMAKRVEEIGAMLFLCDFALLPAISANSLSLSEHALESMIRTILAKMCSLVVYRVPIDMKAATFLVLAGDDTSAPFRLFSKFNHDRPNLEFDVRTKISKETSLAKKSLAVQDTVVIKDSDNLQPGEIWEKTQTSDGYKFHVAHPIKAYVLGEPRYIGVLCFDMKTSKKLIGDDRQAITLAADKIGELYSLYLAQKN